MTEAILPNPENLAHNAPARGAFAGRITGAGTVTDWTKAEAWRTLPKVELHTHLDCSLRYGTVRSLVPGLGESAFRKTYVPPFPIRDLSEFLNCVDPSIDLMQSPGAITAVARGLAAEWARDGVRWGEVRFAPHLHLKEGMTLESVMETTLGALASACEALGVQVGVILCTLRHFTAAQSLEVTELVERYQPDGVVALDLAGPEAGFPLVPHIPAFRLARERGLHIIAHAGEGAGTDSVREILKGLQPERLGHGVRSIEDPDLIERLATGGEHLEVCPKCNLLTAMYPSLDEHPIDQLVKAGLSVGVNTDGRGTADTTLCEEYAGLAKAFAWGPYEVLARNRQALAASFAPDDIKTEVGTALDEYEAAL